MKVFVNVVDMNMRIVIRMLQYSFERHYSLAKAFRMITTAQCCKLKRKDNLQNIFSETKEQTSFFMTVFFVRQWDRYYLFYLFKT